MIRLTQHGSGKPVLIDPSIIVAVTPLAAIPASDRENGIVIPERTRIDCSGQLLWLVQNSLTSITDAIANATTPTETD